MKKNTLLLVLGTLLLLGITFLGNSQVTAKVTDENILSKNKIKTLYCIVKWNFGSSLLGSWFLYFSLKNLLDNVKPEDKIYIIKSTF